MTLDEIVNSLQGEVVLQGEYSAFNDISIDTRNIKKEDIFIAIRGEKFNGNEYIKEASEKGASVCIVDEVRYKNENIQKNTTVIKVNNTREALLDLAEYYRSKINVKIVGITGSAGKTSTKDLVAAALSGKYKVFKTEGNLNNQIGLPLMIFKLNNSYDIAVLEMGMNNLNEIHTMAKAARPDIALITNVGTAHIGNLGSRENILKAKLEITDFFDKKNTLIINGDNDLLSKIKKKIFEIIKIGINDDVNFKAEDIDLGEDFVEFSINEIIQTSDEERKISKERFRVDVPGKHSVLNALLAIACGKILGMKYEEIRLGFRNLQTTSMRLDIVKGNRFNIINDCYNANPDSMKAAIDVLKNLKSKRKVAVLGTMGELGDESLDAHKSIGKYAMENGVNVLITLGEFNKAYQEGFYSVESGKLTVESYKGFESQDEAIRYLVEECLQEGDAVLIKASRAMKFETIVEALKKSNC
jgi:UDP-N-acetylmuramoyl-tripeptide--D-alanyl-D-alanine ligase